MRPAGIWRVSRSSLASSCSSLALIGVRIAPGATLFTVMPKGASSIAALRISIFSPPLLAQYGV